MSPSEKYLAVPTGKPRSGSVNSASSCEVDHHEDSKGFGEKKITYWGSCVLNLNNCMGPAMVLLPLLNQQAGVVTPTLALLVAFVMSSFAATMLCEAMQRIPGNINFEHRYEFATTVLHYYGRKWYIAFQLFYNLSMQASNIAAMIISAQVVDMFVAKCGHHSYALDFQHMKFARSVAGVGGDLEHSVWCDVYHDANHCDGAESTWVISLGYLICMFICIPFGYLNLDDNMWFQWFSVVGLIVLTAEFFGQFLYNIVKHGEDNESYTQGRNVSIPDNVFATVPLYHGTIGAQSQVLGVAVFAYAYVVTIPSWVNEKKHGININKTVWIPATVGLIMKILTGLLGSWAFAELSSSDDQDIVMTMTRSFQPQVTQYSAYLWDITTLIPGIPVLAVMVRYNLLSGNVFGRRMSFFWGVVFPWIATAFCYEKDVLTTMCNWVALVCMGYINFVVPALLYRTALERYPDEKNGLSVNDSSSRPLLYPKEKDAAQSVLHIEAPVNAVPPYLSLCGYKIHLRKTLVANVIIVFFTIASTLSIVLNVWALVDPNA